MPQDQSPKPTDQEPTPMDVIRGGNEIAVVFADGHRENVLVRMIPIRQFPTYLDLQMDEPAMVEFLCERPAGWADTLSYEGVERIVALGDVLNADFFGRWLRRRLERNNRLLGKAPSPDAAWENLLRTSPPPPASPSGTSPT
jgi:hypothetical protein